jgi:hypothetical protein
MTTGATLDQAGSGAARASRKISVESDSVWLSHGHNRETIDVAWKAFDLSLFSR